MRPTVVGVFDKYAAAQRAAQQLRDSGFSDSVFVTDEIQEASPDAGSRPREGGAAPSRACAGSSPTCSATTTAAK